MDPAKNIRRLAALVAVALWMTVAPALAHAQATPGATPAALPVASPAASPAAVPPGCAGLGRYFQDLADLTNGNEGLAIMREGAFNALALPDDEAAAAVASLDALIPRVERLDAPEPARAHQIAYLELLAWYRALAENRDPLAHQRLINDDRRLFSQMGLAIRAGQAACGYEVWNDAWEAAFPLED